MPGWRVGWTCWGYGKQCEECRRGWRETDIEDLVGDNWLGSIWQESLAVLGTTGDSGRGAGVLLVGRFYRFLLFLSLA